MQLGANVIDEQREYTQFIYKSGELMVGGVKQMTTALEEYKPSAA